MSGRNLVLRAALGLMLAGGATFAVPSVFVGNAHAAAGCTVTCAGGSCSGSGGYSCTCNTNGTPNCSPAKVEVT